MRLCKRFALMVLLTISLLTPSQKIHAAEFVTGQDWVTKMNEKEKFISIVASMVLYTQYGIPMKFSPPDYVEKIDQILAYNPYLKNEDIANILAAAIYVYEPDSRMHLIDFMAVKEYEKRGLVKPAMEMNPFSEIKK